MVNETVVMMESMKVVKWVLNLDVLLVALKEMN